MKNKEKTDIALDGIAFGLKHGREQGREDGIDEQKKKPCISCGFVEYK